MKKYSIFSKLALLLTVAVLTTTLAVPTLAAGQVRDNNLNAVMYGGAYSIDELNAKLNGGTGKQHQSAGELQSLFAAYGIKQSDFGQLVDGYVNKQNQVIVNGTVVASDVTTMGRHNIAGSTYNGSFGYPLYLRHPSVSFVSDNLQAFVSMNYDGTYAYAILKPCGNIVIGPGVKARPVVVVSTKTPEKPVVPVEKTTVVYVKQVTPVTATALPTSGPVEAAAGAAGLTITSGAAYAWLKSKKMLASALRKF